MPPEKTYENGLKDAEITSLTKAVARIEGKLDANIEWQRGVDKRLAEGVIRFQHLEDDSKDNRNEIRNLKNRDRNLGILGVLGNILAGIIGTAK